MTISRQSPSSLTVRTFVPSCNTNRSVAAGLFPATRGAAQQRDSLAATVERLSAEVETLKGRSAAADRILSRLPRISGYLQLGYEWSDDASTFFVKRARVDFQGDISPKIDYRLQLEFASPKIVDIYLRYKPLEEIGRASCRERV